MGPDIVGTEEHSRRALLERSMSAGLGLLVLDQMRAPAVAAEEAAESAATATPPAAVKPSAASVCVLGAGGRTGRLIVELLAQEGRAVRAGTRGPPPASSSDLVSTSAIDVKDLPSVRQGVRGCSGVIFAASASKAGGKAAAVDYLGVENVAKACLEEGVERLVLLSSGAVTRPDSVGYKLTNFLTLDKGDIMGNKRKGEDALRALYKSSAKPNQSYTIIRPGGLRDAEPAGPSQLEINQGDYFFSEIPRADVAATAVSALFSPYTRGVTMEVYKAEGRFPLEGGFPPNSGFERRGNSFDELFSGLKSDQELQAALAQRT
ncbi:unnamed protein product [Vitrella brassicaformis CCMP3155]|uniref:NAD(P)-binding domain-containing protein n=1 Tax=Vitrella brassicaformis (strain CCMP3155) TaxID=1169540 RepID=A0A0G4FGS8_VITBC|nr:unnamed protein product [Vitrella brassicaformis CCMP3155]|eukprot:CEM12705.1 unnamed protein product [Vitrella brassicaformis CCMP3155]